MARTGFQRRWRLINLTQPAAGADWTLQATGAATWRVTSLRARLVTSAAVANRQVVLAADNTERQWYRQQFSVVQTATSTTDYCAHTGATPGGILGGTLIVPLPSAGLLLLPGHRLTVTTTAIDVADQWSIVSAMVDETPSDIPFIGDDGVMPVAGELE